MRENTITTGRAPQRSAIAPTKGCDTPHTMFCSAIEKPNAAADTPASSVIGRMYRPSVWRRPMQIEMIVPLRMMSSSMARRLDIPDCKKKDGENRDRPYFSHLRLAFENQ